MPDVQLSTTRVEVILDDGATLTAQVTNADFIRWDRTAAKHGWPTIQAAPFLWLSFVAWSALRREGQLPDSYTWDRFADGGALQVRNLTTDEGTEDEDVADPTPLGVVPG